MFFISNRGNTTCPCPELENTPDYVLAAISKGWDVKVDVWFKDGQIYLGNDGPDHLISISFLENTKIWCVARTVETLSHLMTMSTITCLPYSSTNDCLLASNGYIWTSGQHAGQSSRCIVNMPETCLQIVDSELKTTAGICSDFVEHYKRRLTAKRHFAMIISGRTTCYKDNLLPQLNAFYNENNGAYIHVFVSINGKQQDNEAFIHDVFPTAYFFEEFKCDIKYLIHHNIRNEYQANRMGLGRCVSHFYNNYKAFQLLEHFNKQNPSIVFENCLLFRTDIVHQRLPNLIQLKPPQNSILYPSQWIYHPSWINMAIVICDIETMRNYCSVHLHIDEYIYEKNVYLHPETLITYHLCVSKTQFFTFDYDYKLDDNRHAGDPMRNK